MNGVTIIQGNTGSGKSTQIPQYILNDCVERGEPCSIVVTQPRRIAAVSLCSHVSSEREWARGSTCGYQHGVRQERNELTRILYCTTGVLLQKLISLKTLVGFTHVILDEVHERDQAMDFLLILVQILWRKNSPNVKIILMSATIEIDKLADYFKQVLNEKVVPAAVLTIGDRLYDVQELYLEHLSKLGPVPDLKIFEPRLAREAIDVVVKLLKELDDDDGLSGVDFSCNLPVQRGTVLIFLPGLLEIQTVHEHLRYPRGRPTQYLEEQDECTKYHYDVIPLHADLSMDDQLSIFLPARKTYRKIILATNLAESSITIADVRYVIDFCLTKEMVCDQETNYSCLQLVWASKANCDQRRGRAGRVSDGKCYRLVKRSLYNQLQPFQKPALLQESLDRVVVQAKQLNIGPPKAILALAVEPPNINDIELTILKLKELGALTVRMGSEEIINPFDGDLTFLGRIMAALPIDIELSRLIALGHVFGLVYETVIIAAALSTKSVFKIYYKDRLQAYKSKFAFASGTFCDCHAFLNVYKAWRFHTTQLHFRTAERERKWANAHNIDVKRIAEVQLLVDELRNRLQYLKIFVPKEFDADRFYRHRNNRDSYTSELREQLDHLGLKIILAGAFYPNYYIREPIDSEVVDRELSGKDPTRTIVLRNLPVNEGILYKGQIEQQLKALVDVDDMKLTFENTKAFVEFAAAYMTKQKINPYEIPVESIITTETSNTAIVPAVYFAIKARSTSHKIVLQTFERSAALARVERLRLLMSGCDDSNSYIRENREQLNEHKDAFLNVAKRQTIFPTLPQLKLPDIKTKDVTIHVSTVVDVNQFWAQYVDRETVKQLAHITNVLNDPNRSIKPITPSQVEIGTFVAAPFVLNQRNASSRRVVYYRARILHRIDNVTVEVLFIDYGNAEHLSINTLRQLDRELYKIPPLAFECQLWAIRPNAAKYPNGQWAAHAMQFVCDQILERDVEAEIKAVVRNIVKCDIDLEPKGSSQNQHVASINTREHPQTPQNMRKTLRNMLINRQFAEQADEEHVFDRDYRFRKDAQRFDSQSIDLSFSTDPSNRTITTMDVPKELCEIYERKEIGQPITLTGPFTPLEANHSSCHSATKNRRVQIDGDSVNSVGLEEEPHSNFRRLLVAVGVHLSQTRQVVSLRHTTLMPSIRGLPALIAMLFAPTIELRVDEERTKKIGVLCGLGYDPQTDEALYPDHDMDIAFDVHMTTDDLTDINDLRKLMNQALSSEDILHQSHRKDIGQIRKDAWHALERLMDRPRIPLKQNYFQNYLWNQIHPDDRVPKILEDMAPEKCKLFPLHDDVMLRTLEIDDEFRNKMMYHLIWLKEKATVTPLICDITCDLCNVEFRFTSDLFQHLSQPPHRLLVQKLKLHNL
ncbi:unnamed protein product [Didymodactylos carnosus]|uniref:RNA helicase n=2 Tax=Didymodactylos carnosus TaxID=1234261 RepID=A0A814FKY7_9BILA|nr:unnamed protein product [Didymodactylos carnosus]CAF3756629.1 unnamed protein product [Didymodactylos carnosus]